MNWMTYLMRMTAIINQTSQETGQIVKSRKMTDELMSELIKFVLKSL